MGANEFDGLSFVRGDGVPVLLERAGLPVLDTSFSTMGDYLFSKFKALEKLLEVVLLEMEVPSISGTGVVR